MKTKVTINVPLPGWLSLDDRDDLVEKVRETAYPALTDNGRHITIEWTAESEWVLRGIVANALEEVQAAFNVELYPLDLDALVPVPA